MDDFDNICRDIKSLKIQGASNVAKSGLQAYSLKPTKNSIKKLISLRPTEPALVHALATAQKKSITEATNHFKISQEKINNLLSDFIKKYTYIYTHCHSNTLINGLIFAHNSHRKFRVFSTETRPLYQGRKTATDLANAGVKVTSFTDEAMAQAIIRSDIVLLGADAVQKEYVLNKIGSGAIAELASTYKKPVYLVTDSWKWSKKKISIEKRNAKEVWANPPKGVIVENQAFEKIPARLITGIISELGVLSYKDFIKKAQSSVKD